MHRIQTVFWYKFIPHGCNHQIFYIQTSHLFAPMHGEEMDIGDSDNGDLMYLQVQCRSKGLEVHFL